MASCVDRMPFRGQNGNSVDKTPFRQQKCHSVDRMPFRGQNAIPWTECHSVDKMAIPSTKWQFRRQNAIPSTEWHSVTVAPSIYVTMMVWSPALSIGFRCHHFGFDILLG